MKEIKAKVLKSKTHIGDKVIKMARHLVAKKMSRKEKHRELAIESHRMNSERD